MASASWLEQDKEIKDTKGINVPLCALCLVEEDHYRQMITIYDGYALCREHIDVYRLRMGEVVKQ